MGCCGTELNGYIVYQNIANIRDNCWLYWGLTAKVITHIMVVIDAYVFPGFLIPVLTQISFQSHQLLFSYASVEVRDENTPERNFASTWSRTHNQEVISLIRSLSNPFGAIRDKLMMLEKNKFCQNKLLHDSCIDIDPWILFSFI